MKHIKTAVLCDAMHALGHRPAILSKRFVSNKLGYTLVGRARTLLLKKLAADDSPERLYDGLRFLDTITTGEVVVVGSGFDDYAYWGGLMSTFAQRQHATGAIIDGCTRDKDATVSLNFPVFAKGWHGRDIRGFGTVARVDCPLIIDRVEVMPGDLICADSDGVMVVPARLERAVVKQSRAIARTESKVETLLRKNFSASDILKEAGDF